MGYRFVLWGLGADYNALLNSIKYQELTGAVEIAGVTDGYRKGILSVDGYKFIPPDEIRYTEYDYVVILSNRSFVEIRNELTGMGVDPHKILSCRFLGIPNINVERFIKLKTDRLSIVSNNCWGGIAYYTLGLECLSPFKNLFIRDNDYIRLLEDLPYYLSCEPVFRKYVYDESRDMHYPILMLDDIALHCNHDTDAQEAAGKWNRRLKKFHFENLFVEMYTCSRETADRFSRLNQYPAKVCFVPFEPDAPFLMKLEPGRGQNAFWEAVNSNAQCGANSLRYNLADLLCMEQCLRGVREMC